MRERPSKPPAENPSSSGTNGIGANGGSNAENGAEAAGNESRKRAGSPTTPELPPGPLNERPSKPPTEDPSSVGTGGVDVNGGVNADNGGETAGTENRKETGSPATPELQAGPLKEMPSESPAEGPSSVRTGAISMRGDDNADDGSATKGAEGRNQAGPPATIEPRPSPVEEEAAQVPMREEQSEPPTEYPSVGTGGVGVNGDGDADGLAEAARTERRRRSAAPRSPELRPGPLATAATPVHTRPHQPPSAVAATSARFSSAVPPSFGAAPFKRGVCVRGSDARLNRACFLLCRLR